MSVNHGDLLVNIKRQAKRLFKTLDLSLGQAQEMLAHTIYCCDGYGDLISSVKATSFKNEYLPLTALHPKADQFFFSLLDSNMNRIVERFQVRLVDNLTSDKIKNIIISTFGIEPSEFKG